MFASSKKVTTFATAIQETSRLTKWVEELKQQRKRGAEKILQKVL